jgi:spermidine/putrescine transport system permease protein
MNQRARIAVLMTPPSLWLALLFVLPMLIMAAYTFRTCTFGPECGAFTLDQYAEFFSKPDVHARLFQSILTALLTAIASTVLAYPVAYFLAFRAGAMRLTLLTILIVPAWTSYLLRILAWKMILASNGPLNAFLLSLGLIQPGTPALLYSRAAVVVTLVYVWIPFVALPIFAALQRIDRHVLEAAADLGSPAWQTFLRVTLPLSLPGVVAGFLFVFIPTLGEWVTPAQVGGVEGRMYGNLIQDQFVRGLDWPLGALMSLVMLLLVLVQLAIFSRAVRLSDLAGV